MYGWVKAWFFLGQALLCASLHANVCKTTLSESVDPILTEIEQKFPQNLKAHQTLLKQWGGKYEPVADTPFAVYLAGSGHFPNYALGLNRVKVVEAPKAIGKKSPVEKALIHPQFAEKLAMLKELGITVFLEPSMKDSGAYHSQGSIYIPADATWGTFVHEMQHALYYMMLAEHHAEPGYVIERHDQFRIYLKARGREKTIEDFHLGKWAKRGLELDTALKAVEDGLSYSTTQEILAGTAEQKAYGRGLSVLWMKEDVHKAVRDARAYEGTYVQKEVEKIPEAERTPAQKRWLERVHQDQRRSHREELARIGFKLGRIGLGLVGIFEAGYPGRSGPKIRDCVLAKGNVVWNESRLKFQCYCPQFPLPIPIDSKKLSCEKLSPDLAVWEKAVAEGNIQNIRKGMFEMYRSAEEDFSPSDVDRIAAEELSKSGHPLVQRVALDQAFGYEIPPSSEPWVRKLREERDNIQAYAPVSFEELSAEKWEAGMKEAPKRTLASFDRLLSNTLVRHDRGPLLDAVFSGSSEEAKLIAVSRLDDWFAGIGDAKHLQLALRDPSSAVRREAAFRIVGSIENVRKKPGGDLAVEEMKLSSDPMIRKMYEDWDHRK